MSEHRDPDRSRCSILDAAEQIFAQKGFAGASMSSIAKLSGKSQALLHHHFKSKKGLWEAVKARFGERFARVLLPLLKQGFCVESFIREWPREYLAFWRSNPNLRRIMLWRQLEGDCTPWEATNELFALSVGKVVESQKMGHVRQDLHPAHIISILTGAHLFWLNNKPAFCHRLGLDPDDEAVDERYIQDLERILTTGLLTSRE